MKSVAVFPDQEKTELVEHPEPVLTSPDQIKLRILEIGVCGTDREIAHFQYGTPPAESEHLVLGHEALAEVVEVGSAVEEFQEGDLAVPLVRHPCPHEPCIPCRSGYPDFCSTGDFTERGIRQEHGFMTEYIVEEPAYVVKLPPELREVGVLIEPLTVAEKAIAQWRQTLRRLPWIESDEDTADAGSQARTLVLGAGPVGLLAAMRLRLDGIAVSVYSLEDAESRQARIVEDVGGTYFSAQSQSLAELPSMLGGFDLIVEATGVPKLLFEAAQLLAANGELIVTGVAGLNGAIEIGGSRFMQNLVLRNQLLFGSVNAARKDHVAAVGSLQSLLARWPAVKALITGYYRLEEYEDLLSSKRSGIKQVIRV